MADGQGGTLRRARRDAEGATAALVKSMDKAWDESEACGDGLAITFGNLFTDPEAHAGGMHEILIRRPERVSARIGQCRRQTIGTNRKNSQKNSVCFEPSPRTGSEPTAMSGDIVAELQSSCVAEGVPSILLPCWAGHAAAVFAQMGVRAGMLLS